MTHGFYLTTRQRALLQRMADHENAVRHIDPAENENCIYLSSKEAQPLLEKFLIAQLEIDGELRPFYCLLPWGWDEVDEQPPLPNVVTVRHLKPRDKHNIRVLHIEFGISYNTLSKFYRIKNGSIGWLVNHTNY